MADPNNPLTPRINEAEKRLDAKNLIINGGFDFWQRGTTYNLSGTVQEVRFIADRFSYSADIGLMNTDIGQHIEGGKNWLRMDCNSTVPIGTNDLVWAEHKIEGNFIKESYQAGKSMKFQFKVKSNVTGEHIGYFYTNAGNRIKPFSFTVDQVDTIETKIIDFDWNTSHHVDNQAGLSIAFVAYAGANRVGLTDGWQDYVDPQIAKAEFNLLTAGNYVQITDLMFYDAEFGEDIPFQRAGRNLAEEELLCYRYFYKMTPVVGGTVVASGMVFSNPTNLARFHYEIPVPMRATPSYLINGSYTVYDGNGNGSGLASGNGTHEMIGTTIVTSNTTSVSMGGTAQTACLYVPNSTPSNRIEFNAEL